LSIAGPGSIIGPATLIMKGGQLAVWIRAGRTAGTVTLTASAVGLKAASLELTGLEISGPPTAQAGRQQSRISAFLWP
jgi:hypothetical protein